MPNIDQAAKAFELDLAGRIGAAVQARRQALKMTAVQLAERTKELGYPMTRVTITKIETNNRAGKIDVAELLVLAAALDIPPVLLLVPQYPDGEVEVVPGREVDTQLAVDWIAGNEALGVEANEGTKLVDAVRRLKTQQYNLLHFQAAAHSPDSAPGVAESMQIPITGTERHIAAILYEISQARVELWNTERDRVNAFLSSPTPDDDDD